MRYTMIFCFIILNMTVCAKAMDRQVVNKQVMSKEEQLLRGLVLVSLVTETNLIQINQSQKGYSQNLRDNQKFIAQNHSRVRPRNKYASDKKLCASRCNSK